MDLVIVRGNTEGFYSDRNMHLGIGESCRRPTSAFGAQDHRAGLAAHRPRGVSRWRAPGGRK